MILVPERDIERALLKAALEELQEAVRSVEAALARLDLDGPEDWLDAWRGYACPAPPDAPTPAWRAGEAAQEGVSEDATAIAMRRMGCPPGALDAAARRRILLLTDHTVWPCADPGMILHRLAWAEVGELVNLLISLDPRPPLPPAVLALEVLLATGRDAETPSKELGDLVQATVAAARALAWGK